MITFWSLSIANLADYCEGRPITGLVDYKSPELHNRFEIAASPQDVFDSLVDEEKFARWFGARVQMEHHVGGRWAMGGFDDYPEPAKVLEYDPGRKLPLGWPDGLLASWELEGSEGRTRLTFVQSGFLK